jgi:surface antigen
MARCIIPGAAIAVAALFVLTACANDRGGLNQTAQPGAGGAERAGATFGSLLAEGAGSGLGERDRERAYSAQMRALKSGEPGVPVEWRSPDSGRHGTIVPGPSYQSNGMTCREFSHTIYIEGQPQTSRAAACRNADGNWVPSG